MNLVSIQKMGLLGSNFYWNRYADYNLTKGDLFKVGIFDNQVYVSSAIIPALQKVDKKLQEKGWRLYIKEGYRSSDMYKLLYKKRVEKFGKEMTDRLLNVKDMKHASGLSVDVSIWDEIENREIYLRKSDDGPESLLIDFYKNQQDPESKRCQELQEYLRGLMLSNGFKLGTLQEYFHFDYIIA